MNDLEKLALDWTKNDPAKAKNIDEKFHCQTRLVFQSRLDVMMSVLLVKEGIKEDLVYLVKALIGEIGNNSFDHNIGSWPDIPGIFFGYNFSINPNRIVLADRGQGVFSSLKKVKPELQNDMEALNTAFTERITGRYPENRGNGLKFVRETISAQHLSLSFLSGNALAKLNEKIEINQSDENINGCLAVLDFPDNVNK